MYGFKWRENQKNYIYYVTCMRHRNNYVVIYYNTVWTLWKWRRNVRILLYRVNVRILLRRQFLTFLDVIVFSFAVPPVIAVPNQLLGAPIGTDVTLECHVESYPKSINYWVRNRTKMLMDGWDYVIITYSVRVKRLR